MKSLKKVVSEALQPNQTHANIPITIDTPERADVAYAALKRQHRDLHDYIRYLAPVPIDPVLTLHYANRYGTTYTLNMLKRGIKTDTALIYPGHPSLTESVSVANLLLEADLDQVWKDRGEDIRSRMFNPLDQVATERVKTHIHALDLPPDTRAAIARTQAAHVNDPSKPLDSMPKQHREHINTAVRNAFEEAAGRADPTRNKEYHPWLARMYGTGRKIPTGEMGYRVEHGINNFEDIEGRAGAALQRFHKGKISKKLKQYGVNPDINTYKNLSELEDAVDKLPQDEMSEREKDRITKEAGATKIDHKHWTEIIPETENAAKLYGSNTRWCTTSGMFNHYNKQGPLHILIPKVPQYQGEKYQFHRESNQFTNEKDSPVGIISNHYDVFHGREAPSFLADKNVESAIDSQLAATTVYGGQHTHLLAIRAIHDNSVRDRLAGLTRDKDIQTSIVLSGTPEQRDRVYNNAETLHPHTQLQKIRTGTDEDAMKYVNSPSFDVQEALFAKGEQWPKLLFKHNNNLSTRLQTKIIRHAAGRGDYEPATKYAASPHADVQQTYLDLGADWTHKMLSSVAKDKLSPDVALKAVETHGSRVVDPLLDNPDLRVQRAIIQHGRHDQVDKLISNAESLHPTIQHELIQQNHPGVMDKFINSPNHVTRSLIAKYGEQRHRDILANDSSFLVRGAVERANKSAKK